MNALPKVFFLIVALSVIVATVGIFYNSHARASSIPMDAQYVVKLVNYEPYPDQYYTSSYPIAGPDGFQISNYWTFEPMHHPFGIGEWVYHPTTLTLPSQDYSVNTVVR